MNERISELALKASDPKTGWLDRQKFAELIVRECALQCNHNDDMDRILEHFGVEQ